MGVLPQTVKAASAIEIIDNETQQVAISISSEGVLHVTGASGQTLYIYNVTGVRVMQATNSDARKMLSDFAQHN